MSVTKLIFVPSAVLLLGGAVTVACRAQQPDYAPGQCRAVDGDTLRCGAERVRMVELDAPEMPGHCRRGRVCAPGDPHASKRHLQRLVERNPVRLVRYGADRYGRTLADARVGGRSLTCLQIQAGHAMRQLKWADYGVTRRQCPQ